MAAQEGGANNTVFVPVLFGPVFRVPMLALGFSRGLEVLLGCLICLSLSYWWRLVEIWVLGPDWLFQMTSAGTACSPSQLSSSSREARMLLIVPAKYFFFLGT